VSTSTQRVAGYDALRALAATAVIAIHVMAAGIAASHAPVVPGTWLYATYTFIWFATPSFAFLTGALIWAPRRPVTTWSEYKTFLSRRATVVLYPYLFWTAFYILYGRYTPTELRPQMPLGSYIVDVIRLLALGRASFHLYFIPVVLEFYLIAPLVSRAFARRPWLTGLALWAIGAFTTLVVGPPQSDHLATAYRMLQYTLWLLPAAAAGGWYGTMRTRAEPVLARIWPLLLASGLALRWYDRAPFPMVPTWQQRTLETTALVLTLVGLVSMLDLIARRVPRIAPVTQYLGALAFGAYLVHPLVVAVAADLIERLGLAVLWTSPAFVVAVIAVVVALTFLLIGWLVRYRAVAWVFGRSSTDACVRPPRPAPALAAGGAAGVPSAPEAASERAHE